MQAWSFQSEYIDYLIGLQLQEKLVQARQLNKITDRVLFLEHLDVITAGRATSPTEITPDMISIQRGGKLTHHTPGQLVIYPICYLFKKDLAKYLRWLELTTIRALAEFGVICQTRQNATGVWIADKKIASIGIGVSRWVSFHGVSINLTNSLKGFYSFQPCGFNANVMTRLADFTSFSHLQMRTTIETFFINAFEEEFQQKIHAYSMTAQEALWQTKEF